MIRFNLCIVVTIMSVAPTIAGNRPVGAEFATRSEVIAPQGMAATSHPLATQIAIDILKRGGSAVDAAIAANAALGLMEPTGCGIGGDLFAIVWDADAGKLTGYNGSGRSPHALTLEMLRAELRRLDAKSIPPRGPLPVSVPGAVDGWFALHERFGRLPMSDVLAPAIGYARNGFPLTEVIADAWRRNADYLKGYAGFADVFMPGGRAPAKGEIFRNPALADSYALLASAGRDAFYKGPIARSIAKYMREQGGFLDAEDFAGHHGEWVQPVSASYRGYEVWQLPPNTQGIATLQILNILEGYDLRALGYGSADYLHLFTEAKKLAFEDRARYYADPGFSPAPVAALISKDYAAERRKLIDRDHASRKLPSGDAALLRGDTIYLTVADAAGNMVSLIQSNYRGMGSGMTPPGLGFILQDRGELFSLQDGHANVYAPAKRPFHTIIPAFVTRGGKPWLSFGVMGGAMQPQGQAQVLINLIDFGMNLQEAGDAPRLRHDGSSEPTGEVMTDGGEIVLEKGFDPAVVAELERRGHRVRVANDGDFGGYQAIMFDATRHVYSGASESRKDGNAQGY
ncbi:MAG: gamma-glutamyltransferase [Steroidobacteraceae bacterium]